MAGFCVNFLFYSYAAATVIYLILGAFAASGNAALLIEHYHLNDTNAVQEDEKKDVKSRTLAQYFLASAITVAISLVLYIFCINEKVKKGYINIYPDQNIEKINQIEEDDEDNNINNSGTMPIELAIDNKSNDNLNINISDSSSHNEEGMKEK